MLEYSIEKKEYSHTCYERKTIYSFLVLVSVGKNKVRYLLAFLEKTKPHKQNERGSEIFQPFLVVLGRTLKLCTTETSCVGSEEEKVWLESPCYATWLKKCISVPLFILKTLHLPDWTFVLHKDLALLSARTLNLSLSGIVKGDAFKQEEQWPH